jgi:hypothetical protein
MNGNQLTIMDQILKTFRDYVHLELKEHLQDECNMCRAINKTTRKRCTNRASCNNMTSCKKHKNIEVNERKLPNFVLYHNHLPQEESIDCPRCKNATKEVEIKK